MYNINKVNKVVVSNDKYLFSSFYKNSNPVIKNMWEVKTKNDGIVIKQNGFITVVS